MCLLGRLLLRPFSLQHRPWVLCYQNSTGSDGKGNFIFLEKHTLTNTLARGYVLHKETHIWAVSSQSTQSRHNGFHQDYGFLLSGDHKDSADKSRCHLFISMSLNNGSSADTVPHIALLSALSLPAEGWEGSAGLCTHLVLPEQRSEQKLASILNGIIMPVDLYEVAPLICNMITFCWRCAAWMLRQKPFLTALTSSTQAEPWKGLLLSKPAAMTEKRGTQWLTALCFKKNMWSKDCLPYTGRAVGLL